MRALSVGYGIRYTAQNRELTMVSIGFCAWASSSIFNWSRKTLRNSLLSSSLPGSNWGHSSKILVKRFFGSSGTCASYKTFVWIKSFFKEEIRGPVGTFGHSILERRESSNSRHWSAALKKHELPRFGRGLMTLAHISIGPDPSKGSGRFSRGEIPQPTAEDFLWG